MRNIKQKAYCGEHDYTIEDLEIPLFDGAFIDSAELVLQIEAQPEERRTLEYPGFDGCIEVTGLMKIHGVVATDRNGDVTNDYSQELLINLVQVTLDGREWMENNQDMLDEWAADELRILQEEY